LLSTNRTHSSSLFFSRPPLAAFFGDDTVVVRLDVVQAAVLLERSLLVS